MPAPPDFSGFFTTACLQAPWLFTRQVGNATRMTGTARFHFEVYFDEKPPRLFHAITLEATQQVWSGEGLHLCGRDTCRSAYSFAQDLTRFSTAHKVNGPAKDYAMQTFYSLAHG